jgi:glycosidase
MGLQQNDVIYFILTDRFYGAPNAASSIGINKNDPLAWHGGNFDGIIEKIPYLKNLGITALWITPVYLQMQTPCIKAQPYHGYWALDFNAVDPHLYKKKSRYKAGSKKYLADLVKKLHDNGIKVILDMVVNHTGYDHPGTTNAENNPTPIRSDWFNHDPDHYDAVKTSLSGLPDLNLDNIEVIDYQIKTIASWIKDTGIDVIRMDTAKHVERGFWNYFKTQLRGIFPNVSLLGEVLVFDIDELTNFQKFWGFDMLFDFPVQRAIQDVFIYNCGMNVFYSPFNAGSGIFEKDTNYSNHNRLVSLLDNHDLPGRYFTVALNFFKDKRKAVDSLKLALTLIFTTRGIPQIYYGTEIGMEGGYDPDNRRDFEWNKINANNQVDSSFPLEKDIFEHTQKLIQLRKNNAALYCGSFVCLYVDYFICIYLSYCFDNVVITAIHNGNLDMNNNVSVSISNNTMIPKRIKDKLKDSTLTCALSSQTISVTNGQFNIKMKTKNSMVLIC